MNLVTVASIDKKTLGELESELLILNEHSKTQVERTSRSNLIRKMLTSLLQEQNWSEIAKEMSENEASGVERIKLVIDQDMLEKVDFKIIELKLANPELRKRISRSSFLRVAVEHYIKGKRAEGMELVIPV